MSDIVEIIEEVVEIVEISDPTLPEIIEITDGVGTDNFTIEITEETVQITNEIVESVEIVEQGLQGTPGNALAAIYFNYGDATPAILYTAGSDRVILALTLTVLIAFNGVGAKVSIGTAASHELLIAENESDLSVVSSYETNPLKTIPGGTPIEVFITPGSGATTGRCMILVEYAEA